MIVTCACYQVGKPHLSGYRITSFAIDGPVAGVVDGNIFNREHLQKQFDGPKMPLSVMADSGYRAMAKNALVAECDRIHQNTNMDIVFQLIMRLGYKAATEALKYSEFAYIFIADSVLYAARDTFGIKPLYTGECLRCGRTVLASTHLDLVDLKTVVCIRPFPPGSLLRMDLSNNEKVYTSFVHSSNSSDSSNLSNLSNSSLHSLLAALDESVSDRVHGRVAGVLVSGGKSSTAVLRSAKKYAKDVCAFYFTCEGSMTLDVRAYDVPMYTIDISEAELMAAVPRAIRLIGTFETMSVRAASVLLVGLTKACQVRPDVTTILSGDGFSELRLDRPSVKQLHQYAGLWTSRVARWLGLDMHLPLADARVVSVIGENRPDMYSLDGFPYTTVENELFEPIPQIIWNQTEKMYSRLCMPLVFRAFPELTPVESSEEVHYRLTFEDAFSGRLDRAANYCDDFAWV